MFLGVLVALSLIGASLCFMPDKFNAKHDSDATNAQLTFDAVFEATAEYVETVKWGEPKSARSSKEILETHFHGDTTSYNRFLENAKKLGSEAATEKKRSLKNPVKQMNNEKIEHGNWHLSGVKNKIINLLKGDPTDADVTKARTWIARYLYTLQEFYSNTNWVEMHGDVHYKDLGKPVLSMKTSKKNTPVCKNCENYDPSVSKSDPDSCKGNLLRDDILTSGYKIRKGCSEKPAGKCSHGGKGDKSSICDATGGINKETSDPVWSPHYFLHSKAGKAALSATIKFFIGEGTSLVNQISGKTFERLVELQLGQSLVFVVDSTGSMKGEIKDVKEYITNTSKTRKENNTQYILSTFHDPVHLNTIMSTTDVQVLAKEVAELKVDRGGDCAEFAMSGIISALNLCRRGAELFVFTDAAAKDEHRRAEMENLAKNKNVAVNSVLTDDNCPDVRGNSSRKKRELNNMKMLVYYLIAQETGGRVYYTTKKEFHKALIVIEESLMDNKINLLEKNVTCDQRTSLNIPVDRHVSVLIIEVSGVQNLDDAWLSFPSGIKDTKTVKMNITPSMMMIKQKNPDAGTWTLHWTPDVNGTVFVRGIGEISFSYTLMEKGEDGLLYSIESQPTADREYTVAGILEGSEHIQSLDYLLVFSSEECISTIKIDTASTDWFTATMHVTTKPFLLAINGTDTSGFSFVRTYMKLVRPLSVSLEFLPLTGDLDAEETVNMTFRINNVGQSDITAYVTLDHSAGVNADQKTKTVNVEATSVAEGFFEVTAGTDPTLVDFTLSSEIGGKVTQEITHHLQVVYPYAPFCTELTHNNCSGLTETNCSSSSWNSTFSIYMKQYGLKRIFTSPDNSGIVFRHDDFILGYREKVYGTISASCCWNDVLIYGEDLGGGVGTCSFSHPFKHSEKNTASIPTASVLRHAVSAVAIMIGCFCL